MYLNSYSSFDFLFFIQKCVLQEEEKSGIVGINGRYRKSCEIHVRIIISLSIQTQTMNDLFSLYFPFPEIGTHVILVDNNKLQILPLRK